MQPDPVTEGRAPHHEPTSRRPPIPGAEEYKEFLRKKGCKPGTVTAYMRIASRIHYSGLTGDEWLNQEAVTPDPRQGVQGTAKKTVGVMRAAVSYFESWRDPKGLTRREVSMKLLSANGFRRGEEREAAEGEDVSTLGDRVKKGGKDKEPLYTILCILGETGARVAEVCGMQLEDIDWDRRELQFHGKRGKTRKVAATNELLVVLRNYVENVRAPIQPPKNHLFYGKRWETPIWTTGLNRDLREYKSPDGKGYFTPHQIRHLVATDLVQGGTALPIVRDVLGHESIGTLNPYLKSTKEEQRKALEQRARKYAKA